MTSLPAARLKLWDRGILRPGMKADIVLFNSSTPPPSPTKRPSRSPTTTPKVSAT